MVKKENKINESGRSMVEMLGVLAIIGILSVAGIAAYSSAMKKHRANELLYEASKRATVVAMQAAQGKETLSISEFNNNAVLGFSETVGHADKQFTLTIVGVDDAVCNQVKKMAGAAIKKVEPATCSGDNNNVTLTYHEDLSTEAWASDFATQAECQSPFNWCSGLGTTGQCSDNADCCTGITLNQCQVSCNTSTGEITNVPNSPTTSCTITTENDGTCINGKCVLDRTDDPCTTTYTNADCGGNDSGYYCQVTGASVNGFPSITGGTCQPKGDIVTSGDGLMPITLPDGTSVVYASNLKMTWWAAEQYCAAHGMTRAPKSLFTGSNAPDESSHSLYDSFKAGGTGRIGSYWLNDQGTGSCYAFNSLVNSSTEYVSKTGSSSCHSDFRALCVK